MAQELKAYNVVATADVNPDVVDNLGCTEFAAYDADEVDSVLAEKDAEIRRLKRALWHARADRAIMTLEYFTLKCRWFKDYMKVEPPGCDVKMVHKWANVERKCRAKAEEYK